MTNIQWDIDNDPKLGATYDLLKVAHIPPEPVLPHILASRHHVNNNTYLKCPAFLDYYRNVYVIKSPFNIKIGFDKKNKYLSVQPQGQDFYDAFLFNRTDVISKDDPFLFSLSFRYLFTADEDCFIEELPVTFHDNALTSKLRLISGTYNIAKWFRPVEVAYEVITKEESISIKRGDPLMYIRFVPKNNERINLKHVKFSDEQLKAVQQCVALKKCFPHYALSAVYKLVEKLTPLFKTKKCPFNWRNK